MLVSLKCSTNEFISVPIGFIYVQLQNQSEPSTLWPTVRWNEVTAQYAGLFFRTVGEGSEAFGTIQAENSPRLVAVNSVGPIPRTTVITVAASGLRSSTVSTGASSTTNAWALDFTVSGGEVRPRNTAMRIWQRTG